MHKRLAEIKSDTIANAVVAAAYCDSLDPGTVLVGLALDSMFKFELKKWVPDVQGWLETTFYDYLGWKENATYQELILEFLGDPIRAGKYVIDGTKFATLSKILLDFLIRPDNSGTQVPGY